MQDDSLPEGVTALDHTADVGIDVVAPDLATLFDRAARAAVTLAEGSAASDMAAPVTCERMGLDTEDAALLLASWLREITFEHLVHGRRYQSARFDRLDENGLAAEVAYARAGHAFVREIKGVTYHGLEVQHTGGAWRARVIFDV